MHFATMATKNLWRRKMRTLFTLLGVGTAVAAFVALVGLSRGFENAWMQALLERDTHVFATPKGVVDILSASIDENVAKTMTGIEGVEEVSGELADMVDLDSGEMVIIAGWPDDSYLWQSIELDKGQLPGTDLDNGVIMGKDAASALGLRVGDSFDIKTYTFTLTGISAAGGVMRNFAILMPLIKLQELNNRLNQVTTLNFRLADYENRKNVADILKELESKFPDFVFTEALDLAKNNRILRLFRAMAWGTSTIAFCIGLVVILNTLLMSVMERTTEFGLLSALGWTTNRILVLVVLEGLVLSFVGGCFGGIAGVVGLSVIAYSSYMQGLIYPDVTFGLLLEILLATLLLGLCGSVYPAWRATHLSPAEAFRHE